MKRRKFVPGALLQARRVMLCFIENYDQKYAVGVNAVMMLNSISYHEPSQVATVSCVHDFAKIEFFFRNAGANFNLGRYFQVIE
jgi:hypothetical protein